MIILNNKPYYTEREKLEVYYSGNSDSSIIYVPYSAEDRDFDATNYNDENLLLEFDETEYTEDYGGLGFYTLQGADESWRILQLDMKWVLPKGISSKSATIINVLKTFLDYNKTVQILSDKQKHDQHAAAVLEALRKAIYGDNSKNEKNTKIKKIYIDYPAYILDKPTGVFPDMFDGLYRGLKSNLETNRSYNGTDKDVLPIDDIKYSLLGSAFSEKPVYHRKLVYPDEDYLYMADNNLVVWLNWLYSSAFSIAQLNIKPDSTQYSDGSTYYDHQAIIFVQLLRSLIDDIKSLDNLLQYKFGILAIANTNKAYYQTYMQPTIFLFSGSYIKRSKQIYVDTLTNYWKDYVFPTDNQKKWISYNSVAISNVGLTIGYSEEITEASFIAERPAVRIGSYTNSSYNNILKNKKAFGIQKLNKSSYSGQYIDNWNVYSDLWLPYGTVALDGNETGLFNKYSFGENIKYRKKFVSSPVLIYPLPYGYFSHAIRYEEGIIPGMANK